MADRLANPLVASRENEIKHALLTLKRPPSYDKIIQSTATELKAGIEAGEHSRHDVLTSFILRSCEVRGLGGLAEVCFDRALQEEKLLAGRDLPLAGIPISLKEELQQRGFVSTCGLARKADPSLASPYDGLLVHLLKTNGGLIPHVRSNLPQLVMSSETDNSVYGLCVNPWDASRMVGGSSGGEGCLIASRCSPLGIGSDIAGSVRIPAMACGIFAFKPTPTRVSCIGFESVSAELGGCEGQNLVKGAPGPMARCVDDLAMVMRLWLPSTSHHQPRAVGLWSGDPATPAMPFDDDIYCGRKKHTRWLPLPGGGPHLTTRPTMASPVASQVHHPPLPFSPQSIKSPPLAASPVFAGEISSTGSHEVGEGDGWEEQGQRRHKKKQPHPGLPHPPPLPQDETSVPGPRRAVIDRSKVPLKIGYFLSDGAFFEPAMACKRAVLEAAEALRAKGHEVVEWDPFDHGVDLRAATLAYGALLGKDAVTEMRHVLGPMEQPSYLYSPYVMLSHVPNGWPRRLLSWVLRNVLGKQRWADIVSATSSMSLLDGWEWNRRRNFAFLRLSEALMRDRVDAIISPGLGVPAWLHGQGPHALEWSTGYAWLFNYLGMPAGVVPVTQVRKGETSYYHSGQAGKCSLPYYQRDSIAEAAHQALLGAEGLPVGVHVSSLTNQDELVLRTMKELEIALKAQREQQGRSWRPEHGCPEPLVQKALQEADKARTNAELTRNQAGAFPSLITLVPLWARFNRRATSQPILSFAQWLLAVLWALVARAGDGRAVTTGLLPGLSTAALSFFGVLVMACVPPPVAPTAMGQSQQPQSKQTRRSDMGKRPPSAQDTSTTFNAALLSS